MDKNSGSPHSTLEHMACIAYRPRSVLPYYMVYLAIGLGLSIPLLWAARKRLVGLGLCGAVVSIVFLTPFLWTESGRHGRLGPEYAKGGYRLKPALLENAAGERVRPGPKPDEAGGPPSSVPLPKPKRLSVPPIPKNPMGWP